MQDLKGSHRFRRHALAWLGAAVALGGASHLQVIAGESLPDLSETAQVEAGSVGAMEAQELVRNGDESYRAGRYAEAVEAYDGARELLAETQGAVAWRAAVVERWAQASVAHARFLTKRGDYSRARALLTDVLAKDTLPNYAPALALQEEIEDPIRSNPALTPEHTRQIVEAARNLRIAQGHYALGEYDQAKRSYEAVLRIDPYNVAARRGMEIIASAKADAAAAGYDHTRAELLAQVEKEWELEPTREVAFPGGIDSTAGAMAGEVSLSRKLDTLIIPRVDLQNASLEESIDFLRATTRMADSNELDPVNRGIPFVINLGDASEDTAAAIRNSRVTLQVTNMPVRNVLEYIAKQTRTQYFVDEYAVRVTPLGIASDRLITRTFRVAPDFISRQSASVAGGADATAAVDPFAEPAREGLLARKLSAREVLENFGVSFGPGASASFIGATSSLMVTNTPDMVSLVEQIVAIDSAAEPVQVIVRVTIIRTEQQNLMELGYDWLLDEISSGSVIVGGDSQDITAGNRSGDFAIESDSIDGVIGRDFGAQDMFKAPGALSIDSRHIDGMLRGLSQKGGKDVISVPSVVTRSGQRARIEVQREFIYPTEYEPPEMPDRADDVLGFGAISGGRIVDRAYQQSLTPITPATPVAFTMREVGTVLEVEPTVSADRNYIEVKLAPIFTEFDGFINYGSPIRGGFSSVNIDFEGFLTGGSIFSTRHTSGVLTENTILMPVFRTMKSNTSVTIADGATMVFGGLQDARIQTVRDKTPILGDLPLIGRFFQTTAQQPLKTAIIFMVNVELVDPTGHPYRAR